MLGRRRRRWTNIDTKLGECFEFVCLREQAGIFHSLSAGDYLTADSDYIIFLLAH